MKSLIDPDWICDLKRYPKKPFLKEPSIWAIWIYRLGRRFDVRKKDFLTGFYNKIYWLLYRIIQVITGISIPKSAVIGPGLRIYHFGNIVIHPDVTIGSNCTLRHGVTIGNRTEHGPVPVIGDNVRIYTGACIIGNVKVGNNSIIGANALVIRDVEPGSVVVGVPAKKIKNVNKDN